MKEFLPFLMQGLLMGVDEFYCHRHRVLRRWERIGHPLDTLSFSTCLLLTLIFPANATTLPIFVGLAVFSCLLITKDEWQHRELCTAMESWLHSLLFMIHPVLLIWAAWLWYNPSPVSTSVREFALWLSAGFFSYQVFYWNVWRRDQ